MSNQDISLSVFFPAYYDENNIGKMVKKAVKVLDELKLKDYEVIIIEDGSPDRTGEVADALAAEHEKVRVIHHERNMGYGATLKDGFLNAKLDYVFYSDGDCQFNLEELKKFVALIPYADAIVGFRKHKQYSPYRRFTSFCYNQLIRALFGIHYLDIDCAFKLFPTELFRRIQIDSENVFVDAEIMLKAKREGYQVIEMAVEHLPRLEGLSTGAKIPVILKTIGEVFRYYRECKQEQKNPPKEK